MIEDRKISLELEKMDSDTSFSSLFSIEKYIRYAKKHKLVFRYFPIVKCGFILFNDKTIFLTSEEKGATTLSNEMMLL